MQQVFVNTFPVWKIVSQSAVSLRSAIFPLSFVSLLEVAMAVHSDKKATQQQRRQARAVEEAAGPGSQEKQRVSVLPTVNAQAAGIDIGSRTHWVCAGYSVDPNDNQYIREFSAYTDGLRAIVAWLREHGVTTVAMESTGIYWIPLFELLEDEGFEVFLVDPSYTKQLRGRPKTDRRDCQWIYRLHSVGLLAAAYRPDAKTCTLRSFLRQRQALIRYAARHIQHMQKALEQMNVKLTEALSDITGMTGLRIIRAILRGVHDPQKLAKLRDRRCHKDEGEIARALDGNWRAEHVAALQLAYELWQIYQKKLDEMDARIAKHLDIMKLERDLPPLPETKKEGHGLKHNAPRFEAREALYLVIGMDLTEIEGISASTALTLLAEIGADVSKFPTVKHFSSWLGLCPCLKKTGGAVKSSRTRRGVNRAAQALRMAANSMWNSKGALGAFYRRIKSRLGAPHAVTATAHKLARLVYNALKFGLPYVQKTQEEYEAITKARLIKSLQRRARQLGFDLYAKGEAPNAPATAAS
jgi:transposase